MAEELNQDLIYFKEQKKIMEDKQINYLLNYVRSGKLLQAEGSFMQVYNIVYNLVDRQLGEKTLRYHNEKIEQAIIECYEKIKNLSGIDFIDSFILYTKRINFFIYNMSRLFIYITNNHLKSVEENLGRKYKENDISEFSMYIYKKCFFDKLQIKLYQILNELLIRDERNGNNKYRDNRDKILLIMEIINSMDLIKPKIVKDKNEFKWKETSGETSNNPLTYQKKWFEYFKEETIKYAKNKGEKDIKTLSAPEYMLCELKYINEEHERQKSYINAIFHEEINKINFENLIVNNMNVLKEMDSCINNMFKNNKKEELSQLFKLSTLYPESLEWIKRSFRNCISERLRALKNDKELFNDQKKFIEAVINLKKEMDEFITKCFENNLDFMIAEKEEFCELMKDIPPEILKDHEDFSKEIGFL